MKHKKVAHILLLMVALIGIAGLVYINNGKVAESCNSSLSPYANCVHYRYSEWQPFLGLIATVASLGLAGSFLVKNAKYRRISAALLVAAALIAAGLMIWNNSNSKPSGLLMKSEVPQTISGTVTGTSDGCYADGVCSVTLDKSKTIVTGCGLRADGTSCKTYDQSQLRHGQRVEATVMKYADTYNLECDSCTIRLLD